MAKAQAEKAVETGQVTDPAVETGQVTDPAVETGQVLDNDLPAIAERPLLALQEADLKLTGRDLFDCVQANHRLVLLFGKAGETAHMKGVPVMARQFALHHGALRWAGDLTVTAGAEMGPGREIDAVALALHDDGPVLAVSALVPFTWAAGATFAFGPAAFSF